MLAADAPSAETGQLLEAAGGPEVAAVAVAGTASAERAGIADAPTSTETPPAAADLAGQAFGPAVPDPTGHEGGVIPGLVAASADTATSPSDTVTATPLAPATPIPGVTCRTVQ
jgi:hypothetical protein